MSREIPPTAGLPVKWTDFFHATAKLEPALKNFLGVDWLKIECSGTACLIIALQYLKAQSSRSTVVISGYTCPLVAIAVAQAGLKIRLCDTAPDSYDFDPSGLRSCCDQDTLAVIVTHFGGLAADVEGARAAAHEAGAVLIEDNAQSLGAKYKGRPLGTTGDIAIFSLSAGKGLTIYQGGFMVAPDRQVQDGLEQVSKSVVSSDFALELYRIAELVGYGLFYNPGAMRYVYGDPLRSRLAKDQRAEAVGDVFPLQTELASVSSYRKSVGAAAFERLATHIATTRERALKRLQILNGIKNVSMCAEPEGCQGSWPFITVLFADEAACERALAKLWTAGLGVTKLFVSSLQGYPYLSSILPSTPVPNADSFAARTLTISNSHWLTDSEFEIIAKTIESCVSINELDKIRTVPQP